MAPQDDLNPPLSQFEEEEAAVLIQVAGLEMEGVSPGINRRLLRLATEQKCPCPQMQESLAE